MTEVWRLVNLGSRDGYFIQTVYEAVAKSVGCGRQPPTINLVYPSEPYVCIGVHQLPDLEVDMRYCEECGIPVIRRQVGGGAVYLDHNQQFYHVILPRTHHIARAGISEFFRNVLKAVVCFYRSYGLDAAYKPVNDVVINGRKASGNGAALLHDSMVLIGNVILDFDAERAVRVLRVPDEKLRSHLVSSMGEWVTSLKRELGYVPPRDEVVRRLIECFERELNIRLEEGELSREELNEVEQLSRMFRSREWLYATAYGREDIIRRYDPASRLVKIREGHYVLYLDHRGEKTVRIVVEVVNGLIKYLIVSGDFFITPPEVLGRLNEVIHDISVDEALKRSGEFVEALFKDVREAAGISKEVLITALDRALTILKDVL